jgi:hypothetical protein
LTGVEVVESHDTPVCAESDCVQQLAATGVGERLVAASLPVRCPGHGCPLCADTLGIECTHCELVARAVFLAEWPETRRDPYCMSHGSVTDATAAGCYGCDQALLLARLSGWERPTGHDGEDCLHCAVCGLCKGTERVCRDCQRCDEHLADRWEYPTDTCWPWRWDKVRREEVAHHVPNRWHLDTRKWDRP